VTKTITGSAAGQRGEVVLHVSCDNGLEQDIIIPAGATGDTSTTIDDLPAGTVCTVTETSDGSTTTVTVAITGLGSVVVPAGGVATIDVTDGYQVQAPAVAPINPVQPGAGYPVQPSYPVHPDTVSHMLPVTGVSDTLVAVAWSALLLIAAGAAIQFVSRRGPIRGDRYGSGSAHHDRA
jgi:hypothetical protein